MEQTELKPRLIHTKRGALFALCSTAYVAALSFRDVLWHSQRQHPWLLDLDQLVYDLDRITYWHLSLPAWVVSGVNLAFYAYVLWVGLLLYRIAQGKERVLVVCWAAAFLLGLIQIPISASAASALQPVRALLMAAAFVAAVDILLKVPAGGYPRADNQTSRSD